MTLPAGAGYSRVDAEGGAAAIRFRVPDGVAARIRSSIALGSSDVDVARFPRTATGNGWESPDFASATNRVEIEVRGGMGSCRSADRTSTRSSATPRPGRAAGDHAGRPGLAPQSGASTPHRTRRFTATEPTVDPSVNAWG